MKTVALFGTFSASAMQELKDKLQSRFFCIHVPDESRFDLLQQADYIILRGPKMYADVLDRLGGKKLKLIQRWGTGFDGVDIIRAGELGIAVAITNGINANAVAELTIALIFALYRHLIPLHNALIRGAWDKSVYMEETYEISGKTLGIIGCGHIGRLVAHKAKALGTNIIYNDIYPLSHEREKSLGMSYAEMTQLLKTSDIVSLHLPATVQTKEMVNEEFLSLMKPNAILINTARGSLINEKALFDALTQRRIFGAGLDSFSVEPTPADNPLLTLDNIVVTPHVGGNTVDMNRTMIERIIGNIARMENNELISDEDLVNGKYLITKS